jgi:hypothetical protein
MRDFIIKTGKLRKTWFEKGSNTAQREVKTEKKLSR